MDTSFGGAAPSPGQQASRAAFTRPSLPSRASGASVSTPCGERGSSMSPDPGDGRPDPLGAPRSPTRGAPRRAAGVGGGSGRFICPWNKMRLFVLLLGRREVAPVNTGSSVPAEGSQTRGRRSVYPPRLNLEGGVKKPELARPPATV